MKKNTIYFIIAINFLIIVALSMFLVGIKKSNNGEIIIEQDSLKVVNMDAELVEEYTCEALNVKFSHFKEFTKKVEGINENNAYKNTGFFNEVTGEGCSLLVYTGENEFQNIEELMYSLANGAKMNTNVDANSIKLYENAKLDGNDAFKMFYKNSDGMNVYEIVTIVDDKQYTFIYTGKDENFSKDKGDFLFTKFEFLNKN